MAIQTNSTTNIMMNFNIGTECIACKGKGKQRSTLDGLVHVCKSCYGTGVYTPVAALPQLVPVYVPQYVPVPLNPAPYNPWQPALPFITCGTAGNAIDGGAINGSNCSN